MVSELTDAMQKRWDQVFGFVEQSANECADTLQEYVNDGNWPKAERAALRFQVMAAILAKMQERTS